MVDFVENLFVMFDLHENECRGNEIIQIVECQVNSYKFLILWILVLLVFF